MSTAGNNSDPKKPLPEGVEVVIAGTPLDTPQYGAKIATYSGRDQLRVAKRDLAWARKHPPRAPKRLPGRPRKDTRAVMVRMEAEQLSRLEAWAKAQFDKPSRPEAVRRSSTRHSVDRNHAPRGCRRRGRSVLGGGVSTHARYLAGYARRSSANWTLDVGGDHGSSRSVRLRGCCALLAEPLALSSRRSSACRSEQARASLF